MPRAPQHRWHPVEPAETADRLAGLDAVARHVYLELEATIARVLPFAFRCGCAALAEEVGRSVAEVEAALGALEARGLVRRDTATKLIGLPALLRQHSMAPQNPAQARFYGAAMGRLPACALRDELDDAFRLHLEQTGKPGLLVHYLIGRGERPALQSVPAPAQLDFALPEPAAAPPDLHLVSVEPVMPVSSSSCSRAAAPSHADSSLPCDRPRPAARDGSLESEQERWLEFLEKGTHVSEEHQAVTGSRGPVATPEGKPAADLRHVADRATGGREPGAGLRAEHGPGGPVAAGRQGRAAALLPAESAVHAGLRVREALRLDVVLAELRKLVPEFALQRKYPSHVLKGEVSTGLPGPLHHAIVEGFTQTQAADPPATMADFLVIGEWVKAGGLHYLPKGEWLAHVCNKLPVALEKAAAWEREGRPDPRGAKGAGQSPAGLRPATQSLFDAVKRRREAANG